MARQVIDTTTNNGPYIGDPAKTAFEKTNANFAELYNNKANISGGNVFVGAQQIQGQLVLVSVDGAAAAIRSTSGANLLTWGASYNSAADGVGWFACASGTFNFDTIGGGKANVRMSTCQVTQNLESSGANLVIASSGASGGAVFTRPNGAGNVTGQMVAYQSGIVTAVQFTPTSSADVKDYIEGFSGDACSMIDRLVVITHQYRPDFVASEKVYLSLLAENVKDVLPSATEGDFDFVENVDKEVIVNVEVPNEDGQGTHFEERVEIQSEQVLRHAPLGVSLMPMIALSMRAHQQKNRRIKLLEDALASVQQRLDALESVA